MKSKIRWYREVLELEPHSKVFFPLAKLLIENDQLEEALATLRQGLKRHPEYVEAKLLLTEVLQRLDRSQDLDDVVQDLSESMTEYPAFWEAWARQLDADDQGRDPAMAMRFLAAWFGGQKLSWAQVIESGLQSLLGQEQELPPLPDELRQAAVITQRDKAVGQESDEAEEEPDASRQNQEADEEELEADFAADARPAFAPAAPLQKAPSRLDLDEDELPLPNDPAAAAPLEAEAEAEADADALADADQDAPVAPSSLRSFEAALAETDTYSPEAVEGLEEPGQDAAAKSEGDHDDHDHDDHDHGDMDLEDEDFDEEQEEETFSLRTRTMADLLAEQGDYEGALDIYRELLAMDPDGEQRQELEEQVETMRRLAGEKGGGNSGKGRKSAAKSQKQPATGLKGKKKLISALESLAQRLEAKAAH